MTAQAVNTGLFVFYHYDNGESDEDLFSITGYGFFPKRFERFGCDRGLRLVRAATGTCCRRGPNARVRSWRSSVFETALELLIDYAG
jgi:hypothetical protein